MFGLVITTTTTITTLVLVCSIVLLPILNQTATHLRATTAKVEKTCFKIPSSRHVFIFIYGRRTEATWDCMSLFGVEAHGLVLRQA